MVRLTGIILLLLFLGLLASAGPSYATEHIEDISLRTIDSKTFITGPGERRVVFGHDFHYDDNGTLKDVNLVFVNKISDQASVEVKVQGVNLTIKDPATGVSIKYTLPEMPTVTSDKVSYNHKGLTWEYSLTRRGTKLSAVVSSTVGLETYKFPFTVTGTSASINNGRLEADEFVVKRPKIIDADGNEFLFNWVQDAGEIKFTFDDAGMDLPYTIDPTTTFTTGASGDDGEVFVQNHTPWPPASGDCDGENLTNDEFDVRKNDLGNFDVYVGLVRFDSSSIPDTATITSATLNLFTQNNVGDTDSRNVNGEYFATSNWPIECSGDWALDVGTTAFAEDLSNFVDSTLEIITLSSPTTISKTGFTGFRLGISGGEPTGFNAVHFTAEDDGGANAPELVVTYITDPTVSTFSPLAIDNEGTEFVTVTGTDFESGAQLEMHKAAQSDIICTGEVVNGPGTQLTATCDFTVVALQLWDAFVDNGSGHTDTLVGATELFERPVVSSLSPTNARNDATVSLTVTGVNFATIGGGYTVDPTVLLEKSGESDINCTGGTSSSTSLVRNCPITSAEVESWDTRVTNSTILQSNNVAGDDFNIWISLGIPSLTSVIPSLVDNQSSTGFTLVGSSFDRREIHGGPNTPTPLTNTLNGAQVTLTRVSEAAITCTVEITNTGFTQVTATCNMSGAALGFWNVVVTNNDSDTSTLGSSVEVITQIVGNTQDLGDWDFTGALYTSQFSVLNNSTSSQFQQVVGFPLDSDTLIDDQFLDSDTLNGGLERTSGTRWGGGPGTDHLDVESFKTFDDSLTAFATDTTDANSAGTNDVTMLPATIETDDISYIGMTFPGRILWFNIFTAGEGDWTCIWEYNDNSTWVALLNVVDGTDCYREGGINHVQFTMPSDLSEVAVDTVTSYWVRLRIVAPGTPVTNPVGTQIQWETGVWFTVAPSLAASGGNQQYIYFLGGPTMGCCQQIFVGDAGITTPDHADLELGSDYQIQTLAYLNTSSGANKDIVLKTAAVRIYISSVGTVTADINSGALVLAVTNVPSGLQQITLDAVGGTTTLTVLGIGTDSDTTVGVANNGNTWNFGTNDSVLFFDFVDIEVPKATEVLRWQPTGLPILTIPDQTGTNQPGTLSLPEPPTAGLVMTVGPFIGIPRDQPGLQGNPVPVLPTTNFFGDETGVNLPGQVFFTELITTNSGTAPRLDATLVQLFWIGIALVGMLSAGGFVAKKTQNAIWGGVAVGIVGLPFFLMGGGTTAGGVLPWWIFLGIIAATALTAALRGFIVRPSG